MRIYVLFLVLLISPVPATSQESGQGEEKDAIRRVVETYLYAEEGEERKRTLFNQARVLSVSADAKKVAETPVSKSSPRHKGAKERSRQKIVLIDEVDGGAVVKVETDLSSDTVKMPKHFHYLWLLKVNGEWKIVSILMPPVRVEVGASDGRR